MTGISLGALLIVAAVALVVVAYVSRPLQRPDRDRDRVIEAWVRKERGGE